MKKMKQMMMAFALCILCVEANAQTITVADVEALPGETVVFVMNLSGGKANTYTAMQFDAHFPATGFATTGKYSVSPLWENATAIVGSVDASGVTTIPVASSEALSAADVEGLLSVSFSVGNDVDLGEYEVTLTNLWLGYGTSSKDYLDDVTFKVKVVAIHTVVLDETSIVVPVAATGVDVRVKRTLKANSWNTICLPFAMSEAQTKSVFGDDVKLKDFTGAETTNDAGDNVVGITMKFTDATAIEANHPYLIKVSSAISEFTADGVDIEPEDEPSIDKDEYRTGSGTKKDPYVYHYNSFVGNYVAETAVPEYCLFISNDKFYYSDGSTKMKAFRGYFDLYDVLTSVEDASAHINIIDGDATGISDVRKYSVDNNSYYDLQGRKVENPKKGLYIINNKKVVIK